MSKVSKPSLCKLTLLLVYLSSCWLHFSHAKRTTHGCKVSNKNDFWCIESWDSIWQPECIDNHRVCDGLRDCDDGSDEWDWLCDRLRWRDFDGSGWQARFLCDHEAPTTPPPTPFAANVTLTATGDEVVSNDKSDDTNNNIILQKLNLQKSGRLQTSNESIATVFNDSLTFGSLRCLPLKYFCDGKNDCGVGREDESHCECKDNPKCRKTKPDPPDYYPGTDWLLIMATAVGIMVFFIFCVCFALHWEKHRSNRLLRQREQRTRLQREAISRIRRTTPSNGQLNLGMTLDQNAFNERAQAAGGVAAAPPPYSMAMEFPKPAPAWAEEDLPPPYSSEWIRSDDAPTVSDPPAGDDAQTTVDTGATTTAVSNDAPVLSVSAGVPDAPFRVST